MTAKKILLWGAGSKARILHQMILDADGAGVPALLFDPLRSAPAFETNVAFTSDVRQLAELLPTLSHFAVCVGGTHGEARVRIAETLETLGLSPIPLISKHAIIDEPSDIGSGLQAMPGATVHKFVTVGCNCILNTNSTIDHECDIGAGVHVMGGASIAGRVTIERFATIGTNATVLPDVRIGEGAYVGAGAVITRDVEPRAIMVGVPGRYLKEQSSAWDQETLAELVRLAAR